MLDRTVSSGNRLWQASTRRRCRLLPNLHQFPRPVRRLYKVTHSTVLILFQRRIWMLLPNGSAVPLPLNSAVDLHVFPKDEMSRRLP